ncbi:MAG: UvrD-helicase domain-containing protein [Bacteroidetes bacterium]|nr:UvrD-helicase domain-containing protein [Bacteroidota bacterium]
MPLKVYKSSAGSGKTTTLVNEYLKIALDPTKSFRHILAITFTNKAANEMKIRVIETLKDLIDEEREPSQKLLILINELNLDLSIIRIRAQKLLTQILHNYDEFAISTIDSFIHRIIRTFATDVQLPQNFEVVIDDDDIIPDIIQNLYEKVGKDKELTKVLVDFVMDQADEENSYDPTHKFVGFIKHHMQEDGFEHINKLAKLSLNDLSSIITRLKKKIEFLKSEIIKTATSAVVLCSENNLEVKDFYQGSRGIMAYFDKISKFNVSDEKLFPGLKIQETINDEKWFAAKANISTQNSILAIAPKLTSYFHTIVCKIEEYFFYRLIYSKIYSLALIHEIRSLFIGFTEETGKVHISEFNKKISNEIADQPVPFIYERLGRKYRYFLIDEFQDTSVLQWHNLLPLIDESLSYGNFNMLVGDAKQAIYRFRSGEVELFSSLPDLYKNDGSDLALTRQNQFHQEYEEIILSTNWRSHSEIIKFNNDFFRIQTELLSERTKQIYQHLEQEIPENDKKGGLVSINFVEADNAEDFNTKKLESIKHFVDILLEKKFDNKDICILCRARKSTIDIAGYLIKNNYDVVSSESLLLSNSPKVRLIIAFFKLLVYPDNELATAEFIDNYINVIGSTPSFDNDFNSIRKNKKNGINKIFDHYNIVANSAELLALSTYEIAEFVLREIIKINSADVFIQFFLDFISETGLPLDGFLSRWEIKKEKLFITMSDDLDAIKIMTIHKAKGLDFPAVIVDASNTKNQNTKSEYWEDLELKGFEELKVGLLPLNRKLELIGRSNIYEEEASKTELDFLNIVYVAFTRPQKALFAIGQIQEGNIKDIFSKYLINYLKNKGIWDENKLSYNIGELAMQDIPTFNEVNKTINLEDFISSKWTDLITVASTEDITTEILEGSSSRSYGKLIHKILAEIESADQLDPLLVYLSESGILTENELQIIENIVTSVITHPELKNYFQKNIIIKNETEVMLDNGDIVRPDRVVIDNELLTIIDYKTGEEKKQDYNQIKNYRDAFSKLGYKHIETKLVYIGDVIRVVGGY